MEEKVKIFLEGNQPERGISKLIKEGICVFGAKKTKKNQIMIAVSKKDSEKVFAIYPNICYNSKEKKPYQVSGARRTGVYGYIHRLFSRVGILIGLICFFSMVCSFDHFVFSIRLKGEYPNETKRILSTFGVRPFALYPKGKEDTICRRLLELDGVSFASVKKKGVTVEVEVRTSPFALPPLQATDVTALHSGELVSVIVLRGTALKESGFVEKGERLVGGFVINKEGERIPTYPVARIEIRVEEEYFVEGEKEPFAVVDGVIEREEKEKTNGGWRVKVVYIATQSVNL